MEVSECLQEQESEDVMAVGDICQGLRLDSRLCKFSTALVAGAQVRHKARPRRGSSHSVSDSPISADMKPSML